MPMKAQWLWTRHEKKTGNPRGFPVARSDLADDSGKRSTLLAFHGDVFRIRDGVVARTTHDEGAEERQTGFVVDDTAVVDVQRQIVIARATLDKRIEFAGASRVDGDVPRKSVMTLSAM